MILTLNSTLKDIKRKKEKKKIHHKIQNEKRSKLSQTGKVFAIFRCMEYEWTFLILVSYTEKNTMNKTLWLQ